MAVLQQERSQAIAAMQALVDEALASGDGTMTIEGIVAAAEEPEEIWFLDPP